MGMISVFQVIQSWKGSTTMLWLTFEGISPLQSLKAYSTSTRSSAMCIREWNLVSDQQIYLMFQKRVLGCINLLQLGSLRMSLFLLHDAFMEMENADLQAKFKEYESVLSSHLTEKMTSCALRKVSLPIGGNHTHMAIAVSKEQVLIALVIHLREYFYHYLSLQDLIFQGFQEGCMIVYFSITLHDAAFLAPKILFHLAELKSRFNVTHVIVFGHFTADVDGCRVELLVSIQKKLIGNDCLVIN